MTATKMKEGIILLGAIATFIGAFLTWYIWSNDPRSKIVAIGKVNSWSLPSEIRNSIIFTGETGTPRSVIGARTYAFVVVENAGTAVAEDVKTKLPGKGLFSFNGGKNLYEFENQIEVGDMLPKDKKEISIWSESSETSFSNEAFVTYKNGFSKVDFEKGIKGLWKDIFCVLEDFWALILYFWAISYLLLYLYLKNNNVPFEILSATYGTSKNKVDVLKMLRSKITNNKINIIVSNENFNADPALGVMKKLRVRYKVKGKEQKKEYDEGVTVNLP